MYPYFNFLNMEKSKYASEFSNIYFPDKVRYDFTSTACGLW